MRLSALAALLSGCSFFAVSTPHKRPDPPLKCKTERVVPGYDTVVSGLALAGGIKVIVDDRSSPVEDRGLATIVFGVPLLLISAAHGLGAMYGFPEVERCRRFHRELRAMEPLPNTPPGQTEATDPVLVDARTEEKLARLRRLTTQAEAAARVGQCKVVVQLGETVRELDGPVHSVEFARNATIARCLAPTP